MIDRGAMLTPSVNELVSRAVTLAQRVLAWENRYELTSSLLVPCLRSSGEEDRSQQHISVSWASLSRARAHFALNTNGPARLFPKQRVSGLDVIRMSRPRKSAS